MTLTYGRSSPWDILSKAKRDLSRLEAAETAGDQAAIADALFDLAVTVTSVKDWLKKQPGQAYTANDVERVMAQSNAISSLRDLANAGKHRSITKYVPDTSSVDASAVPTTSIDLGTASVQSSPKHRIKVVKTSGTRHRATELGRNAIQEWEQFMQQYGLSS